MRVVFFGTPEFAVPSLAALLEADVDVVAVVTQPDRPAGRSHSALAAPPVKRIAQAAGIPVWQPERPSGPEFCRQLGDVHPDLGVVVAYGHVLKPELLRIPRLGFVNVHASLLPRWRGAAPIQWALLSGDAETGVTIMRVEPGLDTGAVWHEASTTITAEDTAGTLTDRLSHLGATALIETLPRIALGAVPAPQSSSGVTHAPKFDRDLARIRWDETPGAVACRIRAMDPAPGAWTTIGGAEVKLFGSTAVRIQDERTAAETDSATSADPASARQDVVPGTVRPDAGRLVVATSDQGAVAIAEVQPAGRRRLPAREWLRGARLADGARFE